MLTYRTAALSAAVAVSLIAAPMSSASAHGRNNGLVFGLAAVGAAAIVGVATLLTAPIAIATAPFRGPAYAPPPPAYYAPPPPAYYYAPPPGYYAPPPGYGQGYYGQR